MILYRGVSKEQLEEYDRLGIIPKGTNFTTEILSACMWANKYKEPILIIIDCPSPRSMLIYHEENSAFITLKISERYYKLKYPLKEFR